MGGFGFGLSRTFTSQLLDVLRSMHPYQLKKGCVKFFERVKNGLHTSGCGGDLFGHTSFCRGFLRPTSLAIDGVILSPE